MINYKQKYKKYKKKYLNLKNTMSGGVGPQADTVEPNPPMTTIKCTMADPCVGHSAYDITLLQLKDAFASRNIRININTFTPHSRTTFFINVIAEDIDRLYGQIAENTDRLRDQIRSLLLVLPAIILGNCRYTIERLTEDERKKIGLIIAYKIREAERIRQSLLRMPQPYEIPPDMNMNTIPGILKLAPGEEGLYLTPEIVRHTLESLRIIPGNIRIINPKTIYIELSINDYDRLRTHGIITFGIGERKERKSVGYELFIQKDYGECGTIYNAHIDKCNQYFLDEPMNNDRCGQVANAKYDKCIIKAKSIM